MTGRVGEEDGSHQQVYGQAMEHWWLPLLEIWKPSLIYLLGEWSLIEILYKNEKTTATKYLRTISPRIASDQSITRPQRVAGIFQATEAGREYRKRRATVLE